MYKLRNLRRRFKRNISVAYQLHGWNYIINRKRTKLNLSSLELNGQRVKNYKIVQSFDAYFSSMYNYTIGNNFNVSTFDVSHYVVLISFLLPKMVWSGLLICLKLMFGDFIGTTDIYFLTLHKFKMFSKWTENVYNCS